MNKPLGLSDIEFDLMTFFWEQEKPVSFAEILHFCNEEKNWGWAKTTAHTYVTRLMQKGLLDMNHTAGIRRTYFARISHEQLAQESAQEFIDSSFSGSIKNLLLCLAPSKKLSQQDVDELHQILDELVDSNEPS